MGGKDKDFDGFDKGKDKGKDKGDKGKGKGKGKEKPPINPKAKVSVSKMNNDVSKEMLWEHFQHAGNIVSTDIFNDGYGAVLFEEESSAQEALRMDGEEWLGNAIKVIPW